MSHKIEEECPACGDKENRRFIQKCKLCETSFYVTEEITRLKERNEKLEQSLIRICQFWWEFETLAGAEQIFNEIEKDITCVCRPCSRAADSGLPVRHVIPECQLKQSEDPNA